MVLVSSDSGFDTDDSKQSGSEKTETLYIINSTGDVLEGYGIREWCIRMTSRFQTHTAGYEVLPFANTETDAGRSRFGCWGSVS